MVTTPDEARQLLGVSADADAREIRRAYRRLARQHHPDAGGDPSAFHELQQAVELMLSRPKLAPPPASPSTSRATRPSTARPVAETAWGESTTPRWHAEACDLSRVDWTLTIPDAPHPCDTDSVAVAAARVLNGAVVHPVSAVSRKPGALLNRVSHWVSNDLLARWTIEPARDRGIRGHDVEIRFDFPAGRTRKRADAVRFPQGWTRLRRPDATVVSLVMPPSRDRRATALRAVDHLEAALVALEWPLTDWYRIPEPAGAAGSAGV